MEYNSVDSCKFYFFCCRPFDSIQYSSQHYTPFMRHSTTKNVSPKPYRRKGGFHTISKGSKIKKKENKKNVIYIENTDSAIQ